MPTQTLGIEDIQGELRDALGNIGELPAGYAYLGRGDGSGTIVFNAARRLVYCFDGTTIFVAPVVQGLHLPSLNVAQLEGVRVRLGYPSYDKKRLYITGFDTEQGVTAVGGILPGEQYNATTIYPSLGNIVNFRGVPTDPATTEIYVPGGAYYDANGNWDFFGGDETTTLTAAIAALTAGQHQMVVVCLNKSTGELVSFGNTAVTGSDKDAFEALDIIDILEGLLGYDEVSAVHLYYGQNSIVEADFYRNIDPRVAFSDRFVLGSDDFEEMIWLGLI